MRVMIVGQKWLATAVLDAVLEDGYTVSAVVAPAGDRLQAEAGRRGIPYSGLGRSLSADLVPEGTSVILSAHAHAFIPAAARARAAHGALGYHPSLLPRHRGRDAIRWAIHMGERVTGGTVYRMVDLADAGPILAQEWCFIRPEDDAAALWRRELAPMGVSLFRRVLHQLATGSAPAVDQDSSLATWEPAFDRPRLGDESG
ncbi:formyltransferase family protein [Cupriavidus metallidurans]|uniref:Methionyl-tRNA formyltransferase n=1 Tax=Cupriavidus metallidurans TaxID=119219 RepID=A0A482IRX2_9BURK|nr:formyltransferase family protein [Cupriavidus metallidurans]QBP09869.1 methionyl-tRNA formyltransferase [Cupriavidus metallidurans]